ncbi:F-box protein containing LRR protein [Dioscorea alata]|uniref:F-box protein containing LRR protein n=2 Tax=Dioscorea alata TaxID=55571 RepID=A0ACB7WP13_DIOAL|nr:F-box protein containing LRR protein [Dioscorea alata]KAH7690127.1 F-box protein containing LRR protein [Dioscorea alata]
MAEPEPLCPRDRTLPMSLDLLPSALLATILSRLDLRSLRFAAATCSSFRSAADHVLSFMPSFHFIEIAPTLDVLRPLMPPNPYLRSLKMDCRRLDDSAIGLLARASLHELCLHNCERLSGKLLSEIGSKCRDLRFLSLSSLAERRRLSILFSDLKELLRGCSTLESLSLVFDISAFSHPEFAQVWAGASLKLTSLEIGYIPMTMLTELLESTVASRQSPHHVKPSIFPSLQKLCLSVDYITDELVTSISNGLVSLTHLDLQDSPIIEPATEMDLTNAGLPQINAHGKLKHLSLIRSQEFCFTYFRRVNDLGLLLMSDTCASLESICLGGFCRATDTGFRALLHSCSRLRKLRVSHGSQLTDLMFHDISATSLSLTHVSLRWCNLLTNLGITGLSSNTNLSVLDLRDCRKLGDDALKALSSLSKLHILQLDSTDITDLGLSYLSSGTCPLISLSLRGCKRLTDKCISFIFGGTFGRFLQVLDLSRLPNLSDNGILSLAKSRVPILELRIRECPRIGDTSVMALASMQIEGGSYGSSLKVLDLFESGGITPRAIQWFKKPYFPSLRWLGVTGCLNRDMVDALARSRPFLHVACLGEELGPGYWDASAGWYRHEEDEMDEFEQWLLDGEDGIDDEDMLE